MAADPKSEEMAATAEQLSRQSEHLQEIIAFFHNSAASGGRARATGHRSRPRTPAAPPPRSGRKKGGASGPMKALPAPTKSPAKSNKAVSSGATLDMSLDDGPGDDEFEKF